MGIAEADARWLFQQLIIAVDYCHRLGIANRDIKVRIPICCCTAALPVCITYPFSHLSWQAWWHEDLTDLPSCVFFRTAIPYHEHNLMLTAWTRCAQLDNVLLDGSMPLPIIKLCDFGYSKDEDSGSVCKTACGTPEYMSPEVLNSDEYDGKSADIW